ncbi:MAG: twin-arginine translocase subunit TatC [Candidatus Palauibacterales bacterium]|jgi:sec-independent protein translocase protein TatC|nr:twin-arginine translocase subunit TatC [Candidatus Palauibacterales bacterium]
MAGDLGEMPFLDHLEELRKRLIWSLVALVALSIVGFFLVTEFGVLEILERPFHQVLPAEGLRYTSPTTPVVVTFKLAFVVGFVLALPVIAYHTWAFFSPALYEHEKKYIVPAIAVGFVLFLCGIAMAYFLVLPLGLRFLIGFQAETLTPIITVDEYLRFATRLILAFGIIFEMPVILVVLSFMGLVTPAGLRRYQRHALVVLAILSALLTPADVGTMLMLLVPMVLLYELSIWLVRLVGGGRSRSRAEEPAPES